MAEGLTTDAALVPSLIVVTNEDKPRFTPRELRMIKEHYGRDFTTMAKEDSDDVYSVMAFLKLRREGLDITPADIEDSVIEMRQDEPPDPTMPNGSGSLPPSAASGE